MHDNNFLCDTTFSCSIWRIIDVLLFIYFNNGFNFWLFYSISWWFLGATDFIETFASLCMIETGSHNAILLLLPLLVNSSLYMILWLMFLFCKVVASNTLCLIKSYRCALLACLLYVVSQWESLLIKSECSLIHIQEIHRLNYASLCFFLFLFRKSRWRFVWLLHFRGCSANLRRLIFASGTRFTTILLMRGFARFFYPIALRLFLKSQGRYLFLTAHIIMRIVCLSVKCLIVLWISWCQRRGE